MKSALFTMIMGLALSTQGFAFEDAVMKGPTPEQEAQILFHNQSLSHAEYSIYNNDPNKSVAPKLSPVRPFAEYEQNGYVLFSDLESFSSSHIKHSLAKNLPAGVDLVVVVSGEYARQTVLATYKTLIDPKRLHVLVARGGGTSNTFWSRDGLPVPVISQQNQSLELVDARYFHGYEPDQEVSQYFKSPLRKHDFYYEGGNFMANKLGDCLLIDKIFVSALPTDAIFKEYYGCKRIFRLPLVKGIGHADESVKFITDKIVVTDTKEYVDILKNAGFDVRIMPRAPGTYETYINALLINGTLFMPSFDAATDETAKKVYESLGLKVIPLNSRFLSQGQGSIHCITMNYPPVKNLKETLKQF